MSNETKGKEPYLMAKELAWKATELGAPMTDDYARGILRAMDPLVAPRRRMARWSDFWTFYCLNPELMPFSRDPKKRVARGLAGNNLKSQI
jgi:hypothetical protein